MIAYDDNKEENMVLDKIDLICTKQELDSLIKFLQNVKTDIANINNPTEEHYHFRDWNESWTEKETDLIIFFSDKKQEK